MAIEPLNSAMTYQVQTAVKPQTVTPVNTEVPVDGQTVNVDETTAPVTKPQAEDDTNSGSEGTGSQQQQAAGNAQVKSSAKSGKEILVKDGEPVEYGKPLFVIK